MTFDYAGIRATAGAQIVDKGMAMTLSRAAAGTYDVLTSSAAVTTTNYPCTGAVFDFPTREINGTQILQGDKKVLLSAQGLAVVPQMSDALIIDGLQHAIVNVKALAPAGTVVLYTLQVRKGA
jgi:hypothetical protein